MSKNTNKHTTLNKIEQRRDYPGMGWSKTSYMGGKEHGLHRGWDKNGQKDREAMWRAGKQHGMDTTWSGWSWGSLRLTWHEDTKHGMETWWRANGQIGHETYYLHGKKYAEIEWDDEGNVTKAKLPTLAPLTKTKEKRIQPPNNKSNY